MGILDTIGGYLGPALGGIGTFLGGPVGGAIGSALGGMGSSLISGGASYASAQATNTANKKLFREGNIFNKKEAEIARQFGAGQTALQWDRNQMGATTAYGRQREMMRNTNTNTRENMAIAHARTRENMATQMGFQERMAGTAFQRGMADMKSSGLNPILAFGKGGATAPSGSAGSGAMAGGASGSAPSATSSAASGSGGKSTSYTPTVDKFAAGLNSAINVGQFELQSKQAAATVAQTRQETARSKTQQSNENAQASEQLRISKADRKQKEGYGDSVLGRNANSLIRMLLNAFGTASSALDAHNQGSRRGTDREQAKRKGNLYKLNKYKGPYIGVETR